MSDVKAKNSDSISTEILTLLCFYVFMTAPIVTLSIPEAGETTETPVKRPCYTGKVPIRVENKRWMRSHRVRHYFFLLGYINVFDKENSAIGG